jgi:predicted RNA-binding Zn ribbon-like protein
MFIEASAPPFAFLAGDPSLDLINTVAWTSRGLAHERLSSYHAFIEWAVGAGIIADTAGAGLRRLAKIRSNEAGATLTKAREVRAILRRVFAPEDAIEHRENSLAAYNTLLHEALQRLEIAHEGPPVSLAAVPALQWSWRDSGDSLDSPLWPVVWSAATLLVSPEAGRVRQCGGQDCGWVYVDRSRNGLRRWCRMQTCGTRAKSTRRRERAS